MEKFKKINKEFLLTDSSLNVYGYRLLTNGYQLADFKKNPIGYYMHGTDEHPREQGVLVRWDDLRAEGDKVFGKPCINLSHPRGDRTVNEVENGFLNAASVGHLVALAISSNPEDYLPNQKGPTISKWFNREASLVDLPGNYNALTDLVDENDNPINLADFTNNFNNMKQIFLNPAHLALLNLKADAEQPAVDAALTDLVAKAGKVDDLQTQLQASKTDLANLKAAHSTQRVADLIATAEKETKITKEMGAVLTKQYAGKPDDLKALVDTMKPYSPIVTTLKEGDEKLAAKTWDELDAEDKLENLKATNRDLYNTKFKEKYGVEPNA